MKTSRTLILTLLLFAISNLLLIQVSCSNEEEVQKDEGIIEFNTQATDPSHPLYGFAPSSATLKFKKDKFAIEMSTMVCSIPPSLVICRQEQ